MSPSIAAVGCPDAAGDRLVQCIRMTLVPEPRSPGRHLSTAHRCPLARRRQMKFLFATVVVVFAIAACATGQGVATGATLSPSQASTPTSSPPGPHPGPSAWPPGAHVIEPDASPVAQCFVRPTATRNSRSRGRPITSVTAAACVLRGSSSPRPPDGRPSTPS